MWIGFLRKDLRRCVYMEVEEVGRDHVYFSSLRNTNSILELLSISMSNPLLEKKRSGTEVCF